MVSLITMSGCSAANTGIGAGSSPVLRAGGEALPRVAAEQLTTDRPPRVRAPGRATRSANGSRRCQIGITVGSSARQLPHAQRRRSENWLQFAAGGPGPLTEDRQKPGRAVEGVHGTRNTVPSRAERPSGKPPVLARCERMV